MIVSADRYGGDPGILVASSQDNEDDFPSPSAAAPVRGRTLPPTPRRAQTLLPAAEKRSENAPLPPTRSPASAQIRLRGQVLNLRPGAIRMRPKDSIQSLRGALHAPLIYFRPSRGKIVPKMANLTLRPIGKPDVTDLFSVQLDGT